MLIWIYKKLFFIFIFFTICYGNATERQPWLGNFYEFELHPSIAFQRYNRLASGKHFEKYQSQDVFLNLSLGNAFLNPTIGIELEFTQAYTKKQKGSIDQIKFTGRYLWLDDVAGDPVSLITGLSYAQAFVIVFGILAPSIMD